MMSEKESKMPQVTLEISTEELKALILQLPPEDLLTIANEVEDRAETIAMMKLSEASFEEWNEPEEDIYDADT